MDETIKVRGNCIFYEKKKTEEFKDDIRGEPPERKKRFRRTAEEIERKFIC